MWADIILPDRRRVYAPRPRSSTGRRLASAYRVMPAPRLVSVQSSPSLYEKESSPYLNVGLEYGYGERENRDGSDCDIHRLAAGFQFF